MRLKLSFLLVPLEAVYCKLVVLYLIFLFRTFPGWNLLTGYSCRLRFHTRKHSLQTVKQITLSVALSFSLWFHCFEERSVVCGFSPACFTLYHEKMLQGRKGKIYVLQAPELSICSRAMCVKGNAKYLHIGTAGCVPQTVVHVFWRWVRCLDSFLVLGNIFPCCWAAMALWRSKSSPKEDLDLQLNICICQCMTWTVRILFWGLRGRLHRCSSWVVLTETGIFWCENTSVHLQEICSLFSCMISTVETICFVSASLPFLTFSHAVVVALYEITCLWAVTKEKSTYCLSCWHLLVRDDKSPIKLRKEAILRINKELFEDRSFKSTAVTWGRGRRVTHRLLNSQLLCTSAETHFQAAAGQMLSPFVFVCL